MEANLFHSSPDHQPTLPSYKSHIKNNTYPKRSTKNHPSHNIFPPIINLHNTSLLQTPFLPSQYPQFSFDKKLTNNDTKKSRDSSLAPKKSKTIFKKGEILKHYGLEESKDRPKNVPKVFTLLPGNSSTNDFSSFDSMKEQVDEFSGSVAFSILSPPPSSLPLPTFSLRPKLSCNAEAAGVDAGATNNLRRLLRLP